MKFKWMLHWRGVEIPTLTVIMFLVAAFFSSGMILAPLSLPPNSVDDLTGVVGSIDNANITEDMNPYAKFYYGLGDSQCHQIKERSFFINGNQMPFCVRDFAIFFGMALGLCIALFKRYPIKLWWVIGGLIPIGLDGGLQLITSYESNNAFRLITGGMAGFIATFALGYVFWDISKVQTMRRELVPVGNIELEPEDQEIEENHEEVEEIDTVKVVQEDKEDYALGDADNTQGPNKEEVVVEKRES
jgi:uncharacterized membrane protein